MYVFWHILTLFLVLKVGVEGDANAKYFNISKSQNSNVKGKNEIRK